MVRVLSTKHEMPELLRVQALAAILRTTPKAIYSMIARGEVPGLFRLGKRTVFFRKDVIIEWIESAAKSATPLQPRRSRREE